METDIVNRDNLIVKKINYQGYLEFIYDKRTKLVLINHIPTIKYGKVTIPIFTSDLVISMIKILNKFIPSDEIKINFKNPLEVIAIDKKVEELLPDIKMVKNYNLLNQIRENIRREEAKIRGHILREKEKQDRIWRSEERVMAKKSQVFGIKPEDYRTKEDFERALEQVLIPMWEKKKANIERHLKLNETAYKELMLKVDPEFKCLKKFIDNIDNYIYYSEHPHIYLGETKLNNYVSNAKDESIPSKIVSLIKKYGYDIESASKEDIDTFLDYFMNCDLFGKENLVDFYGYTRDEIRDEYINYNYNGYGPPQDDFEYAGYELDYQLYNLAFKEKLASKYGKYFHPIFHLDSMDEMFKSGVNLLMQIHALRKQLEYYQNIINNSQKATNMFVQNSTISGLIMDLPTWFRIERDNYTSITMKDREKFNLLMIKPGTKEIDLNNTRIFATRNGKSFGKSKTEILNYLNSSRDYLLKCDRFIFCIPDSLKFEEIKKIIDFAFHKTYSRINFVCESQTIEFIVKRIVWYKMKKEIYENGHWSHLFQDVYINIDQNYYRNFWMTTPDNKTFYHLYDYTSDYKYHRKLKCSFSEYILFAYAALTEEKNIEIFENKYLIAPDNFDNLNYEIIEELIFGGYDEPKYLEEAQKFAKILDECVQDFYPFYPCVYNKEKEEKEEKEEEIYVF